jgi:GNAT superfamily N-acetyltransferase
VNPLRAAARLLLGDYQLFRIYTIDAEGATRAFRDPPPGASVEHLDDATELERSPYEEIRSLGSYRGEEAVCVVARVGGEIAAGCWFWSGDTYARRNFWPLARDEAKLVQITTAAPMRGRGLATCLILHASRLMAARGYRRLYARIWHSNRSSLHAFEQAGWRYHAFVVEWQPFGLGRARRITWRPRRVPGAG